jgi:hypothetical protein
MSKPFSELRERLLEAGVAPRHVRRYLRELADHLADLTAEEEHAGRSREEAESAALRRLGTMDDLANAMIEQREFQSWSVRAPWLTIGLSPLLLLAAAYFVACLILWSGWKIFLPAAETPFAAPIAGPIYGLQNVYFQTGRLLYFGAPIFIGWGIGLIAARQRLKAVWPMIGLVQTAMLASTARVHATRPVPGTGGHVSMTFDLYSVDGTYRCLVHALVLFSLAVLPYAIWKLRKAFSIYAQS